MRFSRLWKWSLWILVPVVLGSVWLPGSTSAEEIPPKSSGASPTPPPTSQVSQTTQATTQMVPGAAHAEKRPPVDEESARSTAVALNYCRASFHRLRMNPSRRVWFEEQQHILNNLNLNEIADQEVITLYTAVLDEVSKERIAEKERKVLQDGYKHQVRRQVVSTAFVMGAEISTAQYVNAARTGANSWWDYRVIAQARDLDMWKVEKSRMIEVSDKSNKFLNTFWDLAKRKQIPDEWLIRGNNLDELEMALSELDPTVRLRVLKRMEPVMVCYPPYYYHLGRTQQAQGMWLAAIETYRKLIKLGEGHFRSDDMLASGLANTAIIQAYLKDPAATPTAQRALKYATGAWQVNLVCARILHQHGHHEEAEEAVLRNLDVDLERPQSLATLVSLYVANGEEQKLLTALNDPEIVAELPALSLLQIAGKVGVKRMPAGAMRQLVTSLYVFERASISRTQLVCMAAPTWGLEGAQTVIVGQQPELPDARGLSSRGNTQLTFKSEGLIQLSPTGESQLVMEITYPDGQPVKLYLKPQAWSQEMAEHVELQTGRASEIRDLFTRLPQMRPRTSFVVTDAEFGQTKIALWDRSTPGDPANQQMLADQKRGTTGSKSFSMPKPTQVIIEGVKPLPPLTQELLRPVTPKPNSDKSIKPFIPSETKQPSEGPQQNPATRPTLQSGTSGANASGVQLSDEIESAESEGDVLP